MNNDGERQGIFPHMLSLGADEEVTARAGLPLVLEAARALHLDELVEQKLRVSKRRRGFTELEKIEALMLVAAAGGERMEDVRVLSDDKGLLRLLDRTLPSPDALLDFLHQFADASTAKRPEGEVAWVPPESGALVALREINRALVGRAVADSATTATVDHDGTIIESHKRDALVAYEGTRGYQPLVAVWAEEDLIVADEFRDANVPGGKDPLSSVQRAFEALPAQVVTRFFRGDSADYYEPLLKYLVKERIGFAISADMSPELSARCRAVPENEWVLLDERTREFVHVAEVEFTPGNWEKDAAPLRYIGLRFTPRQTELLTESGPRYHAVVTNRAAPADGVPATSDTNRAAPAHGVPATSDTPTAQELVRWHRLKAGTIEHVHRGLKDELGAGVLPSGKFAANAAWFRINALTYNVLTFLRRHALPERFAVARPKRLRFELFTVPGRLAVHQRQLTVNVSAGQLRTAELIAARQRLLAIYRGAPLEDSKATPAA